MVTTLELHGAQTGNSIRAAIALEEAGLPYTAKLVDLSTEAQRGPAHLALNPLGKVPVLVEAQQGRERFVLTQSNAIILYIAGKAPGRLFPPGDRELAVALERFFFFVTDVIAVSHAAFSLRELDVPKAQGILNDRMLATLETAERYLGRTEFMAGDTFSAADIAGYTIARSVQSDLSWGELPNMRSWLDRIGERPAVRRGLEVFDKL